MSIACIYTYSKFRTAVAVLLMLGISLLGAAAAQSDSQTAQKNTQLGTPNASPATKPAQATTSDADKDEEDDADVPPFARGKMDKATYLRLRDEHVAKRRGISDLIDHPQARSQAIRKMERQAQLLRQQKKGTGSNASAALGIPSSPVWMPLGPDPIPNGQTDPNSNIANELPVSGRVTAIAIDQTDATGNTVYVGTAQGGVYRTLDGGSTWTPLMDAAESLAIGAITVDPLNHNIVFVGTGEGNLSADSFFGVGLYIITNATTTADLAGPFNTPATSPNADGFTDVFTGRSITQILVNPTNDNQILVSTSSGLSGLSGDTFSTLPTRGVYFSINALSGSPTFTRSTIQTVSANRLVTDMTMDPVNPNSVLVHVFGTAAAGDGGVWMSTAGNPWNGTATWTQELIEISDNGKFAVNRVGHTTTFLLGLDQTPVNTSSEGTLFSSTNGTTWTELTAARGFCGGQCFYDMPIALDPTTALNIYVGGAAGTGIGAGDSGIFGKSTDGGTTFGASQNFLHADSHAIAILTANPSIIYTGNDGGIFKSTNAGTTWSSINNTGFTATQFESISAHSTDANFSIGGTQDNGTLLQMPNGSWFRADFGDGGYSAIDQSTSSTSNIAMYHTYFNVTNSLIGYASINTGVTAAENTWNFFGCQGTTPDNGINCTDKVLFYAPLTLGPGTPNTIYFGTDRLYHSADGGNTNVVVSQAPLDPVNDTPVSDIGISPQDDNVRIVGLADGQVFATSTGSATLAEVTGGWPAKYVSRTVIDPSIKTTAYVTLDGYGTTTHIWKTTNLSAATPTWTATGFNIDVPVNAFAVDPGNSSFLYAGTDIGVFFSDDGGATWNPYGPASGSPGFLPRVAVFDMKIVPANHKVRIATHGRGAWETVATNFTRSVNVLTSLGTAGTGANVNLTATITPASPAPTGTVTFFDGGMPIGSATLNGSGAAVLTTSFASLGVHTITAFYGGDSTYGNSTASAINITVIVNATTITVSPVSPQPTVGASINLAATVAKVTGSVAPTGTVTFFDGTAQIGAPAAINASGIGAIQASFATSGVHNVTAVYSGDATYSGSTSQAVAITVIVNATTTTVSPVSPQPTVGASINLAATVAKVTGTVAPTGTVTFFDGTAQIGAPAAINASGIGAIQASFATSGVHNVTAVYSGDATYSGSTSQAVAITVLQPDYTVTLPSGASANVKAGSPATFTINVSGTNGFNGVVNFACTSGLPSLASCSFNPVTVTGNGSATLTISTTASTAAPPAGNRSAMAIFGGLGFFGLVFAALPGKKRRWKSAMMLPGVLMISLAMASCGGKRAPVPVVHNPGTPTGTYSITVTATSGNITPKTVALTLTVQ